MLVLHSLIKSLKWILALLTVLSLGPLLTYSSAFAQERPNGSLFIRDVQKTDAGNLTCSATNTHGRDSISYLLTVQGECVVGGGAVA